MPAPEIPPGYALVRLSDLAEMTAARPPAPEPPGDAWSGLAAAVAMVTAKLSRHDVDLSDLAEGVPPAGIIAALAVMAATGLRYCLEGSTEKLLRDMGELAAMRGRGPDGRQL